MRNVIFFDGPNWDSLRPLTSLRPSALCQVGALTIAEKWDKCFRADYSFLTPSYLQALFPVRWKEENILIDGSVLPNERLISAVTALEPGQMIMHEGNLIAFCYRGESFQRKDVVDIIHHFRKIEIQSQHIRYPEDILNYCDQELRSDIAILTASTHFITPDTSAKLRGAEIYIEEGAKVYDCILNAREGPIYVSKDAEIMENAVIKGPAFIGPNSTIHVGAKVYSHTCLGPYSKIGGEIKRTTVFGYSNKAHDGYLGDSVIGRWCNLGADTNNSNMKNTYGQVSLWDMSSGVYRHTNRQFLGLIMGDHTMAAINTSFMTGSVTGTFANVYGSPTPRWSQPFSWGSEGKSYLLDKAIEVAHRAMERRGIEVGEAYEQALRHIHQQR